MGKWYDTGRWSNLWLKLRKFASQFKETKNPSNLDIKEGSWLFEPMYTPSYKGNSSKVCSKINYETPIYL